MSKRKEKKERVKQRWDLLRTEIDNLFDSIMFESFTEWKDIVESEIIRIVKKYNVLSWYGTISREDINKQAYLVMSNINGIKV